MADILAEYTSIIVIGGILMGIVYAILCYKLATLKGHSAPSMFSWLGFFFGALALLYVVGMPDYIMRKRLDSALEQTGQNSLKESFAADRVIDDSLPPL